MNKNLKISIFTEVGKDIGFGHLMRCLAIYDVFAQYGYLPKLAINSSINIDAYIEDRNYILVNWLTDNENTIKLLKDVDIVFIDSYLADEDKYKEITSLVKLTIFIDDNYRINYPNGVILNSLINADLIYTKDYSRYTYLLGTEFQTLRRDFWNLPYKPIKKEIDTILITLGGNDLRNLSETLLKAVNIKFKNLRKIFILGSNYDINKLNYLIDANTKLYQNVNTREMIQLYLSADVAITAGGQSLIELSYIGVPSIVVCVAENQKNNIEGMQNAGLIFNLGSWNEINDKKIIEAINKLSSNETREDMSRKMKRCFNSNDNNLIINQILKIFNKIVNN